MSSFSQSRRAIGRACKKPGAKSFRNCRSRVSVLSLNYQLSIINFFPVATFISNSAEETESFGRQFAEKIRPGDVLALTGGLGSGKTQFVKGLVAGLGSAAEATSPTFTLIHEYTDGPVPIYHFDFFRLEDRQRSRWEPSDLDGKAREGLRAGTRANQSP